MSFHFFPFRYIKEELKGLPPAGFLKALNAEGVPDRMGYSTLNNEPYLQNAFQSKNFKKMYPVEMLNFDKYLERNQCLQNDILCNEEGMLFIQNILLGPWSDMDYIVSAIDKIHKNADSIKKLM